MYQTEYNSKLMSPAEAVELIPSRGTLSMGMAVSEPPALLTALENRVKAGKIEELARLLFAFDHGRGVHDSQVRVHERHQAASVLSDYRRAAAVRAGPAGQSARRFLHAGKFQRDAADAARNRNRRIRHDGRADGQGRILQLRHQLRLHGPDRANREEADRRGKSEDAARVRRFVGAHLGSRGDR